MTWETYPAKTDFVRFAEEWDRLNARLNQNHPLFDSRFIGELLEYFADGRELLCIDRRDATVCGALIVEPRGFGRWASFLPSQLQASAILIDDARWIASLFEVLPGYAWTLLLAAADPRYAPDILASDLPHVARPHAYTIGIHRNVDFADYWAQRPKNLRANVRRHINRANREAQSLRLVTLHEASEMSAAVARFGALETAGWKGAAGTAVSIDNRQGAFYARLLARFAQSGHATVHELYIGEHLAASRLVVDCEHMLVILKTAYDESLARFAPGRLLLYHVIEQQRTRHPEQTIEFYTNATRDQYEWATFGSTIQDVQVFRNPACAAFHSTLRVLKQFVTNTANRRLPEGNDLLRPNVSSFPVVEGDCAPVGEISDFMHRDALETSLEWFGLLQRAVYAGDDGVRYYAAEERGRVTVILPVRRVKHGCIRSIEALSNFYTALYAPLVAPDGDLLALNALIASAMHNDGGTHLMRFAPLDPKSRHYPALMRALRANGLIPLPFFCFGNWFQPIEEGWDDYLKRRGRNLRSSIKRRTARFTAAGGNIEVIESGDGLETALAAFQEIYTASWKRPEPYPEFVPSLIRYLAVRGKLRLGIAHLGGRAIAAQLWIVEAHKASIFKVAYHPDYAAYSPGTVLTAHLFRHAIETDRVREIDFLIGDDEYKRIWMSNRRERWGIIAYNPGTAIGLALLGKELGGRALKALAENACTRMNRLRASCASQTGRLKGAMEKSLRLNAVQQTAAMNWRVLPIAHFAECADAWDTLVRSRLGTPFLESTFLQPCIDVFASGREMLCLLYVNDHLRAAAIVQRTQKWGVWQTFQPSQLPLGAWVSDGNIDLVAACDALIGRLPGIALSVGLSQLDSRLETRREDNARIRYQDYIQTAWVDVAGSFADYWEARGKNLRQNTRKQHNKLQSDGIRWRMDCVTEPSEVGQAIDDYGRLESAGWKAADGTAISAGNAQGRFYQQMLERFCRLGRGRIYRLRFDDKVVAMDLCIADPHALVILKTAYDESYKSISPSTLLRHDQFEQLFAERQFARIEFFGKVMEWHTRWTAQSRPVFHVTVYRWAWLKRLHTVVSARATGALAAQTLPPAPPVDTGRAHAAP